MKRIFVLFLFFSILAHNICSQSYEDYVDKAMNFINKDDFNSAEKELLAALRLEPANPSNTMLLVNLGTVQRRLKKYGDALNNYNAAISKYPFEPVLLHSRAALYCEIDSLQDALKDYNTILLYKSDDMEALSQRSLIYINAKEYDKAQADLKKLVDFDKNNLPARKNIALTLKLQKKWQDAEELYTDLIYENRTDGELYYNRAECYLNMNKLAKTRRDLEKAVEFGYTDDLFYILRGRLKLEQYDKRGAREDFLKARESGANKEIIDDFLLQCK